MAEYEDYDMPDLGAPGAPEAAAHGEEQDLSLEDELAAELEAALDEQEEQQPAAAAEAALPPAPPPLTLSLQQPEAEPLPLAADGYVDEEKLTREQRNRLDAQKVSLMSEEQLDRYEAFRRSSLRRPVQQLMSKVLGAKPNEKAVIALSSVAKSFVGELVEGARAVAEERGERGALLPSHVHAAYQRMAAARRLPAAQGRAKRKRLML